MVEAMVLDMEVQETSVVGGNVVREKSGQYTHFTCGRAALSEFHAVFSVMYSLPCIFRRMRCLCSSVSLVPRR